MAEEMELALRTPLNTIIGYSELLLEDADEIKIDNFSSDINKIKSYGVKKALIYDLKNVFPKLKHGNISLL